MEYQVLERVPVQEAERFLRQRVLFVLTIVLVWTAFGIFFGAQNYFRDIYVGKSASLPGYMVGWLLCGYSWGFLTVPVLRFVRRFSLERFGWPRFLLVHVFAACLFSAAQIAIYVLIAGTISGNGDYWNFYKFMIVKELQSSFLVYFAIVLAATGYKKWSRRAADPSVALTTIKSEKLNASAADGISQNGRNGYLRRLSIKENGRVVLVEIQNIEWIASYGNYLLIHTPERRHIYRETMASMETKLDPSVFVRIRRSAIVRIERIKEFKPTVNGGVEVILKNETRLTASRRYRKNLESFLKR